MHLSSNIPHSFIPLSVARTTTQLFSFPALSWTKKGSRIPKPERKGKGQAEFMHLILGQLPGFSWALARVILVLAWGTWFACVDWIKNKQNSHTMCPKNVPKPGPREAPEKHHPLIQSGHLPGDSARDRVSCSTRREEVATNRFTVSNSLPPPPSGRSFKQC